MICSNDLPIKRNAQYKISGAATPETDETH